MDEIIFHGLISIIVSVKTVPSDSLAPLRARESAITVVFTFVYCMFIYNTWNINNGQFYPNYTQYFKACSLHLNMRYELFFFKYKEWSMFCFCHCCAKWNIPDSRVHGVTSWGSSGADRNQVGPMLATWTFLSGMVYRQSCIPYKYITSLSFTVQQTSHVVI